MKSGWITTKIGSQVLLQRGFDITKAQQRDGKVPVVSSGGISSYHDVAMVKGPGVVLGRKGTLGSVFYLAEDYWPHDTTLWVKDFKGNLPRFVYYFFRSMSAELLALDNATANPALNRNHVHPIQVFWPSRSVQESVVDILGALDDKIATNSASNQKLEQLASTLFASWFVDFDPVAAKRDSKTPISAPLETINLFPSHFEESELGPIPQGWRVGCVGDVARDVKNQASPLDVAPETPYIGLEHMPRRSICLDQWGKASDATSGKLRFKVGDFLFGKLRPYFHKVGVAQVAGVCSTDIVVVEPRDRNYMCFVLGHLSSIEFVDYNDAGSGGTRMPRTSWQIMSRYPVVVPPASIAGALNSLVEPVIAQLKASTEESRTLAELRDMLLVPLISGELTIRSAEKAVGAAL